MSDNKKTVIVINEVFYGHEAIMLVSSDVKILENTLYNHIMELFSYSYEMERENSEEVLRQDDDYIKLLESIRVLKKILNQMGHDL